MKITLREAVDQLETYTADEIAELLTLAGKTGAPNDTLSCPMANYFYDVLGRECRVDNDSVYSRKGDWESVALPKGVQHFISLFDEGQFEHLEVPDIEDEDEEWGY
jgi:hypothetical protein